MLWLFIETTGIIVFVSIICLYGKMQRLQKSSKSYPPISILSKLFMKIIAKRNAKKFNVFRRVKQAGFNTNHLQVMISLIEKCYEYKIIIALSRDFEKSFYASDTITHFQKKTFTRVTYWFLHLFRKRTSNSTFGA